MDFAWVCGIVTSKKGRVLSSQVWAYVSASLDQLWCFGKRPLLERDAMDRKAAGTRAVFTS